MGTIYRRFFVVGMVLLVLTACSSGPSDDFLLSDLHRYSGNKKLKTIQILHKGKCESISVTVKARGVDEAWLVDFEYDYDVEMEGYMKPGGEIKEVILYVKYEGRWQRASGSICP